MPLGTEAKWSEVTQLCLTLCDPMDCSLPSSSIHGIFQARILEWIAISFSRGSSQSRDRTRVSCIAGRLLTLWATREMKWVNSSALPHSGTIVKHILYGSSQGLQWALVLAAHSVPVTHPILVFSILCFTFPTPLFVLSALNSQINDLQGFCLSVCLGGPTSSQVQTLGPTCSCLINKAKDPETFHRN